MSGQPSLKLIKLIVLILGALIILGLALLVWGLVRGPNLKGEAQKEQARAPFSQSQPASPNLSGQLGPVPFSAALQLYESETATASLMNQDWILFSIENLETGERRFELFQLKTGEKFGVWTEDRLP